MDGEAARLSSDEIALQLQDKATFATALAALKKNITGPPSAIFTVPIVWPIFVSLSTNISPKLHQQTLTDMLEIFRVAEDLYALSPFQREAVQRYKEAIAAAKTTRLDEKKAKEEQQQKELVKQQQQVKDQVSGQRKQNSGRDRGVADSEARSREVELRAARQAALFAKHDIALQEQRAALGHHPLRSMGQLLGDGDMRQVLFGTALTLRVGQVVAVPRSSGGLCYGEILSSSTASRCFFNPKTEHNQELVLVRYGSKQKSVPVCLLGVVPQFPSSEAVLEPQTREDVPQVGDFVASADCALLQLVPGIAFVVGELVAVARSRGGFTIGRVMSRHSAKCLSGAPHNVAAWRVLTEEPDDESEGKSKLVATGMLGRLLSPWASRVRIDLENNGPAKANNNTLTEPNVVEDLNVEDKLRERFGDFTPFLDDDDDELIGELEQEEPNVDGLLEEPLESEQASSTLSWTSEPLFG